MNELPKEEIEQAVRFLAQRTPNLESCKFAFAYWYLLPDIERDATLVKMLFCLDDVTNITQRTMLPQDLADELVKEASWILQHGGKGQSVENRQIRNRLFNTAQLFEDTVWNLWTRRPNQRFFQEYQSIPATMIDQSNPYQFQQKKDANVTTTTSSTQNALAITPSSTEEETSTRMV